MALHPLEKARKAAAVSGRLLDLVDTNFHSNGFIPPDTPFRRGFEDFLSRREYHPDPQGALPPRVSIAEYYAHRGFNVSPEDVVICASTSEAYSLLFSTFGRSGDSVALPSPGYPLAEELALQNRLRPRFYRRSPENAYQITHEQVRSVMEVNTALIVAVSPDNPTGSVLSTGEYRCLESAARDYSALLVWDEVFSDLLFYEAEDSRGHPLGEADGPVTFVLNGASKLFASPDIKIGWIVISGDRRRRTAVRERLSTANDHYLSSSSIGQAMLPYLFSDLGAFRRQMRQAVATHRTSFLSWLEGEPRVEALPPAGGIHALCRIPSLSAADSDHVALALLEGEDPVYVHPGYFYRASEECASFVISLLVPEERLQPGLAKISRTLDEFASPG